MLIHDCGEDNPLKDVSENLMELMKSHVNSIIEFMNLWRMSDLFCLRFVRCG